MIDLANQYRLATEQQDFLQRIAAAAFGVAASAFAATPITGSSGAATQQAQRLALANAMIREPGYATVQFAWVVVSRPAPKNAEDLTDAFITSTITATFDAVAQQMILPASVVP